MEVYGSRPSRDNLDSPVFDKLDFLKAGQWLAPNDEFRHFAKR